jgi:mannose-1-phosphate guanylyltransferase/mannose-1-phosphate guanylyltransferase/mannose-6-phosphate isomerase
MIFPVILSGGTGTKLCYLSRAGYPKQLLPVLSKAFLFQRTLERLNKLPNRQAAHIICNKKPRFTIAEQTYA